MSTADAIVRLQNALDAEMADHSTCDREKDGLSAALASHSELLEAVRDWASDWSPWGDWKNPGRYGSNGGWTLWDYSNFDKQARILRALAAIDPDFFDMSEAQSPWPPADIEEGGWPR